MTTPFRVKYRSKWRMSSNRSSKMSVVISAGGSFSF